MAYASVNSDERKNMSGLERARRRAGLTRGDVARFTVRTPQSVARWENGQTMPPKGVMLQLANLFRCPVEALVD